MKILLALDGSPHSRFAEDVLARLPLGTKPELLLISVCPVPDLHHLGRQVTRDVNRLVDDCRAQARSWIDEAAQRCRTWCSEVETRLLDGHPGKEIIHTAQTHAVDLVVVGARGLGGVHRFLLGSVSEKVVKYAPCPVLLTHEREETADPTLRQIIIADDGSDAAADAVSRFAAWQWDSDVRITLLSVLESLHLFGMDRQLEATPEWKELVTETRSRLTRHADLLRRNGATVDLEVHEAPNAADDIIETAKNAQADLIVIGSTGKSGWEQLLLGSVSNRIIHHAPCSIWVERFKKPAPAA